VNRLALFFIGSLVGHQAWKQRHARSGPFAVMTPQRFALILDSNLAAEVISESAFMQLPTLVPRCLSEIKEDQTCEP
jgi:hypothetical protein